MVMFVYYSIESCIMVDKTFVCLSKSKKNKDFCVAGKIIHQHDQGIDVGEWIRPVNQSGAITRYDSIYGNSSDSQSLDIITAIFIKPTPEKFQTENYLIDETQYWKKEGVYSSHPDSLRLLCDYPETLWINNHQTSSGKFDQVHPDEVEDLNDSLYFIEAGLITFITSRWEDQKVKVRAEFTYNEVTYNLKVTDHKWLNYFESKDVGRYTKPDCFITVSLALEAFENLAGKFHYKLIAEII